MNLNSLLKKYLNDGYEYADAKSKVCQDVILFKISKSPFINNVTLKGGVVMHNISHDKRRATRDIDLDFIRYSLDDKSIKDFVNGLNKVNDGIKLEIVNGKIIELSQQDYKGKRLELKLQDNFNNNYITKLDLGVHKNINVVQDELVFCINYNSESIVLLANSPEQIFTEKLKSLLMFGSSSTRYKDVLDFYYLINEVKLNKNKLYLLMTDYIFLNENLDYNNISDIYNGLNRIFNSERFMKNFSNIRNNWLELPINDVTKSILEFINLLNYSENINN